MVIDWSSVARCAWSGRIKALLARLGASSQGGLAELVCGLDGSVAFSIAELLDLVARYMVAPSGARGEIGSSILSSLVELYRVTRGVYGVGLPAGLHRAVNKLLLGDEGAVREIVAAVEELVKNLAGRRG